MSDQMKQELELILSTRQKEYACVPDEYVPLLDDLEVQKQLGAIWYWAGVHASTEALLNNLPAQPNDDITIISELQALSRTELAHHRQMVTDIFQKMLGE